MNGAGDTITAGTTNTGQCATALTATSSTASTTFGANGYTASVGGTNQIVSDSSFPRVLVGAGSDTSTVGNNSLAVNSTASGYTNTYEVQLQNLNATSGFTTGVPSVHYYKAGRNAVSGDVIGSEHFYGKNVAGTKVEFARVEAQARTVTAGAETGYWGVSVPVAGVMTNFLQCNANTNSVNMFKSVDMNGQILKTSSNNINIDASTSSGAGIINLTTKAGTAGSGAGLTLTGNTLTASTVGASAGQYLCLTINGTVYKIALLNV
jgi:hypothetical protein